MPTEINIKSFLWNYKPGVHDKIWGFVQVGNNIYCFWGRRGNDIQSLKSIQFKKTINLYDMQKVEAQKLAKGYKAQVLDNDDDDYPELEKIYPGFVSHLKTQLLVAKLAGTIRRDGEDSARRS